MGAFLEFHNHGASPSEQVNDSHEDRRESDRADDPKSKPSASRRWRIEGPSATAADGCLPGDVSHALGAPSARHETEAGRFGVQRRVNLSYHFCRPDQADVVEFRATRNPHGTLPFRPDALRPSRTQSRRLCDPPSQSGLRDPRRSRRSVVRTNGARRRRMSDAACAPVLESS